MAARAQTIVVAAPRSNRRAPARRSSGGFRRRRATGAASSPARVKERQNTRALTLGSIAAVGFGLVQRNVRLPGIQGVPNSLTYGVAGTAIGVLAKSDTIVKLAAGPLYAGLHNAALKGFGGDSVAGEFDSTEGEFDSTEGEFDAEDVTAGDFDDL